MHAEPASRDPGRATRLLVVCHANVARSAAAALLLERARDERGQAIEVVSAGTHAIDGQPVSARTAMALRAVLGEDVSLSAHRSHHLTLDDVRWADVIVTMEAQQVRFIRRAHPGTAERTTTLSALAGGLAVERRPVVDRVAAMQLGSWDFRAADDVIDPAGGGDAEYERAMSTLVVQCGELARRLAG